MKIASRGGHNNKVTGASTSLGNEVVEDRLIYKAVMNILKEEGKHDILDVTAPDTCTTQSSDLSYGVSKANTWGADIFISFHFNSLDGVIKDRRIGSEVCVYSKFTIAQNVANNLIALGFVGEENKPRRDNGLYVTASLYELNSTKMPAMIVEICFLDSKKDMELYRSLGVEKVARAIANGIDKNIPITKPTPPLDAYNGETIVLVASADSPDYLAAQYFNKYLGYGILTPALYKTRINPKDLLIGLGGQVCKDIKCSIEVVGIDGVDTCKRAMELIQSLK